MKLKKGQFTIWICNHCNEEYPYEPVYCNDCGTRFVANKTFTDVSSQRLDCEQALEWWNTLNVHQKDQLYLQYYGAKGTDKYPDEIEVIWKYEHETYKQSLEWWRNLDHNTQEYFKKKYNKKVFGGYSDQVVLNEIEEIWKKETLDIIEEKANQLKDDEYLDIQTLDIVKASDLKINQKQFKEFNPELFKSYISKFSNEDKLRALSILSCEINTTNSTLNNLLNRISSYGRISDL